MDNHEMTINGFNTIYSGKWRLEEEKEDSPYYDDYKYRLFAVFPNAEYPAAAFDSIGEALWYVELMKEHEEEAKGIDW